MLQSHILFLGCLLALVNLALSDVECGLSFVDRLNSGLDSTPLHAKGEASSLEDVSHFYKQGDHKWAI